MAGKYNINGPRNVVLLPQQRVVGEIIGWPIHPSDHAEYDDYVEKKLNALKRQLEGALKDAGHPVDNQATRDIAENVNKISDKLYKILKEMEPGVHIDELKKCGARIERKLAVHASSGSGHP